MTSMPTVKAKLLEGKRGLIVGIANDQSIAWGCARAFRAFGAELAVTYLNEKAHKHVEPLAKAVEAPIFLPLAVVRRESERMSRPDIDPFKPYVRSRLSILWTLWRASRSAVFRGR